MIVNETIIMSRIIDTKIINIKNNLNREIALELIFE